MGEQLSQDTRGRKESREYRGEFMQDLRYALRSVRGDRTFAIVTTMILAMGIGANTAVFSVVNTVLLRPLPFPDAARLTWLAADGRLSPEARATAGLSAVTYTVDAYEEFQRHNGLSKASRATTRSSVTESSRSPAAANRSR